MNLLKQKKCKKKNIGIFERAQFYCFLQDIKNLRTDPALKYPPSTSTLTNYSSTLTIISYHFESPFIFCCFKIIFFWLSSLAAREIHFKAE